MDDFGFVKAVYRFGQGVIVRVTDAANRGLDPREGQPLGIANGQILPPTVGVMNEATFVNWAAIMQRLLQSIQHKICLGLVMF